VTAAIRELATAPDTAELARAVVDALDERGTAQAPPSPSWSSPLEPGARARDLAGPVDDEVDELAEDDEPPGAEDATPLAEPPAPDEGDGHTPDADGGHIAGPRA